MNALSVFLFAVDNVSRTLYECYGPVLVFVKTVHEALDGVDEPRAVLCRISLSVFGYPALSFFCSAGLRGPQFVSILD